MLPTKTTELLLNYQKVVFRNASERKARATTHSEFIFLGAASSATVLRKAACAAQSSVTRERHAERPAGLHHHLEEAHPLQVLEHQEAAPVLSEGPVVPGPVELKRNTGLDLFVTSAIKKTHVIKFLFAAHTAKCATLCCVHHFPDASEVPKIS